MKSRIGTPIIEPERDAVTYCEQTFDDTHILSFTFWDDEFKDLHYFAIDGWYIFHDFAKYDLYVESIMLYTL